MSEQPSRFKQEWEAKKLLNNAKKKTKKKLMAQGLTSKQANKQINAALSRIANDKVDV